MVLIMQVTTLFVDKKAKLGTLCPNFRYQRTQRCINQYTAGLLPGLNIVLQPDARIRRVIRRVFLTPDFNVSAEMASVPTVLCRKGVVQIDSLWNRKKSMPLAANNNVVPDKVIVVVFTDLISITSANLVASAISALSSCHQAQHHTAHHSGASHKALSSRSRAQARTQTRHMVWASLSLHSQSS